jgi:hypothetical protein
MTVRRSVPAALLLALAACGGSGSNPAGTGSPTMRPGESCLRCHTEFTAAGTVYASLSATQGLEGVTIEIDGFIGGVPTTVTMHSNSAGNFYTTVDFTYGPNTWSHVVGATAQQPDAIGDRTYGDCNRCHPAGNRIHP